jgi:hypothetical protein
MSRSSYQWPVTSCQLSVVCCQFHYSSSGYWLCFYTTYGPLFYAAGKGLVDSNFKMLANLSRSMVGGFSQVASMGGGKNVLPDIGGVAGSLAKGALQGVVPGKVPNLGGLFGKKK